MLYNVPQRTLHRAYTDLIYMKIYMQINTVYFTIGLFLFLFLFWMHMVSKQIYVYVEFLFDLCTYNA